ncbi:MAG: hydrogenase small subunit [Candidatus Baltobacteraceae bacterium]
MPDRSLWTALRRRGISRRSFVNFCGAMAAALALPASHAPAIAAALGSAKRPRVVWLEFSGCTGCTESMLRSENPGFAEIVLSLISLDYHETLMAPAGEAAERSLREVVEGERGRYIAVVEGAIPTGEGYCTIGGRSALDIAREVCGNAAATIAVGACATYGGWPRAHPDPTGALGLAEAVPGIGVVNLPGCPVNGANVAATLVHYLTFGRLPATDQLGRPLFAYGQLIHDSCERRAHYDAGEFVEVWGDEAHRKGWCLYKLGCKGPTTFHNCPVVRWNGGTSWPVGAGHGCIGCSEPQFWDANSPFYDRLPDVPGFGIQTRAEQVGLGLVIATGAAFAVHGVAATVAERVAPIQHGDEEHKP